MDNVESLWKIAEWIDGMRVTIDSLDFKGDFHDVLMFIKTNLDYISTELNSTLMDMDQTE